MFSTRTRITLTVTATAALALLAAGCGNDDAMPGMDHGPHTNTSATATATAEFNDADVTFLQMMYPHHAQAIEMAKLAPGRTENQQVLALAAKIEQAQTPEMQQITVLLQRFGKPAPASPSGHDMGGHGGMPGMLTADQMSALPAAAGTEFDQLWLTMMIEHHTGAIGMANTELSGGANADAQALARAVISTQQAEIDTMRGWLDQG